jgi:thioesterase domain-containing protein
MQWLDLAQLISRNEMPTIQGLQIPMYSKPLSCDKNTASASHTSSHASSGEPDKQTVTQKHQRAMVTAVKNFAENHSVPWEKCVVLCSRRDTLKTLPVFDVIVFAL